MSNTLCIANSPEEIAPLAGFAQQLQAPYSVLLLQGTANDTYGAEKLLTANLQEIPPADALASALAELAKEFAFIAMPATMFGKDVLARVAGILDSGMVSDVVRVISPTQFVRPVAAGTILATEETLTNQNCFTVRLSSFSSAPSGVSVSENFSLYFKGNTRRDSVQIGGGSRPDLTQAKVVVSGGRPLKDAQTFETVIGGLADKLGGAVGATRAAVDSGIAPNECQVGQTGKIVAPDLYIAAGISGSTQHIAGMKDSKCIVAINKDPDAPIFEIADIGIVGDLYDVIPQLMSLL